jgi:TnpA family transposase
MRLTKRYSFRSDIVKSFHRLRAISHKSYGTILISPKDLLMPRMRILDSLEQKAFDAPPVFNSVERKKYFYLPAELNTFSERLRTPTNQVCFLVTLGYFKAANRFFVRTIYETDIDHVANQLGIPHRHIDIQSYEETTYRRHKQELIRGIESGLTDHQRQVLDSLFEKQEVIDADNPISQVQRNKLTLLKTFSQSTRPSKIKTNIQDLQTLRKLYQDMEQVIASLDLTHDGMRYYAHSVIKSEIFQVSRRTDEDRYLHVLAFITHQYFRLQDALIDAYVQVLQSTLNSVQREHKEKCYLDRLQRHQSIRDFVDTLATGLISAFSEIQTITGSSTLNDAEKIARIQVVLSQGEPQRSRIEGQITQFKQISETALKDADFYAILESRSLKLQNRVADIIKDAVFTPDSAPNALMTAIQDYKQRDGMVDKHAPMTFLSSHEQEMIFDAEGKFRVSLYKALFFIKIVDAIKAGTLNLSHSYKYRSLDDYLITPDAWAKNRDEYLKRADLEEMTDCKKTLNQLAQLLDGQYHHTNLNVLHNKNPFLKFRADGAFSISTPKAETTESQAPGLVFPEQRYIPLMEILSTVNHITGFLDTFEHWQVKYNRAKPPERSFLAGIMGYGCNIGPSKIAQISTHITQSELDNTINWYFSIDNIQNANDKILAFLDRLELPNLYRNHPEMLHTASDGQKFEVRNDSLNANYSFKYFGQGKGVSVYSFIDERHLLFHSTVISAAEREAAYVLDGLMHNDVIKSDIHSTDTHGYSEVIFGAMHLLGFSYAPRIKKLKDQRLYAFQKRKEYEAQGYRILPDAYIDIKLIEEHWEDILRFIATIKLKETTASQLFKRLNSYSKQHVLYRALKEFGKIIKTIFILKYIDDVAFRQAIEKQLNKIEHVHRFTKAVSFGNNQEFIQGDKQEQDIAEGCRRLIKNAIICWNYLYLSQKITEERDPECRQTLLEAVTNSSVVTWRHINLHGEYDFSEEKLQDSIGFQLSKILALNVA